MIQEFKLKIPRIIADIPIYIIPIVLFSGTLLGGKALFWGTPSLQFIPWRVYAFENLIKGILPLWNPLNGMGTPFLANYQLAFFYPPSWILFLFWLLGGITWLAWAHTLLVVTHLIWAGLGMSRLIKSIGFGFHSQTISAIAFSLCTYWVARAGFFSMIWAGAWLTWIIYEVTQLKFPRGNPKAKLVSYRLVIMVSLQFLAGHAQLTLYTIILAFGWLIFRGWLYRDNYSIRQALICFILSVGLASILASIQLMPTAEFLLSSQRSSLVNYETALTYSFWPWRFITFLAPDFFGNPGLNNYWGYASYWEDAVYIGLLPFLIALSTLKIIIFGSDIKYSKELKRFVLFLWGIVLTSCILALGKNTPIFPFLYKYIPTFNLFNAPARYMIWCVFALSVLAGIGVNYWSRPEGRGLYWLRLTTAGSFAVSLGALLGWYINSNINLTFIRATAISGLLALGAGLLTLGAFRYRRSKIWTISTIILIGGDLLFAGWQLNPNIDKYFYSDDIDRGNLLEKLGKNRLYLNGREEYRIKFKRFLRFNEYRQIEDWSNLRYTLLPNLNLIENISTTNNFDPLLIGRYAEWMSFVDSLIPEQRATWLKIMSVSVIERSNRNQQGGILFEKLDGLSRFSWVKCADYAKNGNEALEKIIHVIKNDQMIVDNQLNYVVIEGQGKNGNICSNHPGSSKIEIISDQPQKLMVQIESQESGWLVISDTWYPGWVAKIDNVPTPIYKGNFLFRAIEIPTGLHKISIYYRPFWFNLGTGISVIGLIFLLSKGIFLIKGSGDSKKEYKY
jgi:hypothetical protein